MNVSINIKDIEESVTELKIFENYAENYPPKYQQMSEFWGALNLYKGYFCHQKHTKVSTDPTWKGDFVPITKGFNIVKCV